MHSLCIDKQPSVRTITTLHIHFVLVLNELAVHGSPGWQLTPLVARHPQLFSKSRGVTAARFNQLFDACGSGSCLAGTIELHQSEHPRAAGHKRSHEHDDDNQGDLD